MLRSDELKHILAFDYCEIYKVIDETKDFYKCLWLKDGKSTRTFSKKNNHHYMFVTDEQAEKVQSYQNRGDCL